MAKLLILLFALSAPFGSWAQEKIDKGAKKDDRTIYKYKQYQKFDFAELSVEGDMGSPGDLSINPRLQKEFRNKLPYRKNFNPELHRSIERVR